MSNSQGQARSYVTLPLVPIKASLLTLVPAKGRVVVDLRELFEVTLTAVYQLILVSLGEQEFSNQSLILFAQIKKHLRYKKIILVFFHLQIICPLYESFFTNLESLAEEDPQLRFVFHFAQNILTERIARQLKNVSLPYQQIAYVPFDARFSLEPALFLAQLNDNEQVILRQIFRRRFMLRPEIQADVTYLQETGLIRFQRNSWLITWRPLVNFFYHEVSSGGELEVVGENFFFAGEEITTRLSLSQQKLLAGLLGAPGRVIKKERLAQLVWGKTWCEASDWALDKALARLRSKLKVLTGQNWLRIKRGQGVIFENGSVDNRVTQKTNKKTLFFTPLVLNQETLAFYFRVFNTPADNHYLFAATPKTRSEIAAWLKTSITNSAYAYWSVYYQNKLVGHCGLKYLDEIKKTASLGDVLSPYALWGKIGEKVFRFVLAEAQKRGLTTLYHHPNANNLLEREALMKVGFKSLPGSESKLLFQVD